MLEVFLIAALMHWVIAPDRFTSAARAATGAAGRAAGAGVRDQWNAGRPGRQVARTARRDDWHARGGWWRRLLGVEHAAVVTGKTARSAGRLTGAAVKPVPAAIKRGWVAGQDRHRARVEGKRVPLTVNPPWWHPKHVEEPEPGQVEDGPQDGAEDTPEPVAGTGQDSPTEPVPTTATGHDIPPQFERGDRLVDDNRKTWIVTGVRPQIDADTYDLIDESGAPGYADISRPDRWQAITEQDDPTEPTTQPEPTEGAPVSVNVPSEINDLTTLHTFAQAVIDDAEENGPGSQYAAACASLSEFFGRDFGREVGTSVTAFEEACAALNQAWTAVVEAAEGVKSESLATIGG